MKVLLRVAACILFGLAGVTTLGAATAHAGNEPAIVTPAWNTTSTTAAPTTTEATTTTTTTTTTTATTAVATTATVPPEATSIVSVAAHVVLPATGGEVPWLWVVPTLVLGGLLIALSRAPRAS
jgi:hypothetical protein